MFKRQFIKVMIALSLLASLLGGVAALGTATTAAKAVPGHHSLACVEIMLPPCV